MPTTTYRPTSPGSLVTRREIGGILGLSRARVHQIVSEDPDFPRPIDVLWDASMPIWDRADVERWREEHRPPAEPEAA